jgi:hypothetical protein
MARRKIKLQDTGQSKDEPSVIDDIVQDMGTVSQGFAPTDQVVYEIELSRIRIDQNQPRHVLPYDLRACLLEGSMSPSEVMEELVKRAHEGDMFARLVLGRRGVSDADHEEGHVETGLYALAESIKQVGLRQPINVYAVDDDSHPSRVAYLLGEGERRYWAHQLLVYEGEQAFSIIKALVGRLPDDMEQVHLRQQAENAARQDLPAVARARAMYRIREQLRQKLGTQVPKEKDESPKLTERNLDDAVGRQVRHISGRAISGRMVRNYLRLLTLPPYAQEIAEAASLTERQLRPVFRLQKAADRDDMVEAIINQKLSGREVMQLVTQQEPPSALRRVTRYTVPQRFEKKVLSTAKSMHEMLSLPNDEYQATILQIAERAKEDTEIREALWALKGAIDEALSSLDTMEIK